MGKSSSLEDYLKCILVLQKKNGSVRSIDIAEELGVTKPSVSNAMKKLRTENMIYFNAEGHIFFTDEGGTIAERVYNKHTLLSRLLCGMLDYDFDKNGKRMESGEGLFGALEVAQRQYDIACEVKDYLKDHPRAAVVNLGCGLDDTYRKCDNGACTGYNIDMPDVIAVVCSGSCV